jgi:hypothetical protein
VIIETHLVWERGVCGLLQLVLVLGNECRVDLHLRGRECGSGNEFEGLVTESCQRTIAFVIFYLPNELPGEPEEWLLEVVLSLSAIPGTTIMTLTLDFAEISKYWRFSERKRANQG